MCAYGSFEIWSHVNRQAIPFRVFRCAHEHLHSLAVCQSFLDQTLYTCAGLLTAMPDPIVSHSGFQGILGKPDIDNFVTQNERIHACLGRQITGQRDMIAIERPFSDKRKPTFQKRLLVIGLPVLSSTLYKNQSRPCPEDFVC